MHMAAVGSLTNPLHPEEFILFYSDADHQLASTQGFKSKPSSGDVKAINDPEVPTGPLLNPSSLAVVLLNHTICVYSVINSTTKSDKLICRLSPGFEKLPVNIPEGTSVQDRSIAACSESDKVGNLYYLVYNQRTKVSTIYSITISGTIVSPASLPGSPDSPPGHPQSVPLAINLNPQTYIAATYGKLNNDPYTYFLAVQDIDNYEIYVYNSRTQSATPIKNYKALRPSPIAMLFSEKTLVVYFLGCATQGEGPTTIPIYRAVSRSDRDLEFRVTTLDNAPPPTEHTQLAAVLGSESHDKIILTYVNEERKELVNWEDKISDV